jgi:putative oxidoreductase
MVVPAGEVEEKEVDSMIQLFEKYYRLLIRVSSGLQSPFLLAVRLYWGWQFMQTGWGKLTDIGKVVQFFTDLGIPAPALNAYFVSALEFGGGMLLILGLGSRLIALPLAVDMIVAYITADREALLSIFSNPDKFTAAAPYTFLVASLIVLIFGPGRFSLDALLAARRAERQVQSTVDGGSRVVVQN